MLAERDAKEDSASAVDTQAEPGAPWRVLEAEPLDGFRVRVRFRDGVQGLVELGELIRSPDAGVFATLADPAYFASATVVLGAVTWPNGVDLAPDATHAEIIRNGICILR